jgi:protein TonB
VCAYPPLALARRLEGSVLLELLIDEQGAVATARVVRPAEPFTEAALKCVAKWRHRPATRGGVPVRVTLEVPVTFRLPR